MTNYDKIVAILSHNNGNLVKAVNEGEVAVIFSSIENNGNIRGSCFEETEGKAMNWLGRESWTDRRINDLILKISPLYRKPKLLKVGDKVDVSEEAEYFAGDNGLKISEVREDCYIIGGWHIPFWAVSPHLEEDDEKEPSNKELLEKLGKCLEECKDLVNRL